MNVRSIYFSGVLRFFFPIDMFIYPELVLLSVNKRQKSYETKNEEKDPLVLFPDDIK